MLYWDPVPHIDDALRSLAHPPRFGGRFAERNELNVPGPFYAAGTDNCWVGRLHAPRHILYGDSHEHYSEFVFRQPRDPGELRAVLRGMADDPTIGWARDGDAHWTPALVREWWRDRGRVRDWLTAKYPLCAASDREEERELATGLHDYLTYLDGELATDLRAYLYFLDHGAAPSDEERLPAL
ncbi:hypothetical protein BJY16_006198 [Actinoplanes octamycinicus]|uniref:Ferredoxin n=1 Tax=Actinoplanes octamycinicus TaxID=135948 RepID=A0A7W7H2R6_9ACTN|nr:hypothetical protein [Actinoplanes octamycinicus]MBB4742739.1 hypothetical protein [Actinoplanes octamycinicus]